MKIGQYERNGNYENVDSIRYYKFKGEVITIWKGKDGLWRDKWDCVYAVGEAENSFDPTNRCGISLLSLPPWHIFSPLNDACRAHDNAYSNPTIQIFKTRQECDSKLREDVTKATGLPVVGWLVYRVVRLFGGVFWERKETK